MITQYLSKKPVIPASVFIAEGAKIVGDVELGEECSVWFNAVIRGDVNFIRIGRRTNIQDSAIIHVTLNKYPTIIADEVTIGHGAILHGCTIHEHVLIGMGAKVLDRAIVNKHCIIAAGALILEGYEVPEGTMMAGVPAKPVRKVTHEEIDQIKQSIRNYIQYAADYRALNAHPVRVG